MNTRRKITTSQADEPAPEKANENKEEGSARQPKAEAAQ